MASAGCLHPQAGRHPGNDERLLVLSERSEYLANKDARRLVAVDIGLAHADHRATAETESLDDGLLQQEVTGQAIEPVHHQHACFIPLHTTKRLDKAGAPLQAISPAEAFIGEDFEQD